MKKTLAWILSAVLLLGALAGCGGKRGGADADSLVGKWTAEIDMADFVNRELAGSGMDEVLSIKDFAVVFNMEFRSNGTYTMAIDEQAFAQSMAGVKDQLKDALTAYLQQMLDQQGLGMSVEDAFAMSGQSLDDMLEEAFSEENLMDSLGDASTEGQYLVREGRLYTSDSVDEAPDPDDYVTYTLKGDVLELDRGNGEVPGEMEQFLPLVFHRV